MDSPPPPSSPLPSPSLAFPCQNPAHILQQPLPVPPPRRRSSRRTAAVQATVEAHSDAPLSPPSRRGRSKPATASRRGRRTRRKAQEEEEIIVEETAHRPRVGNDDDDNIGRAKKRRRGRDKVSSDEKPASVVVVPSSDPSPSEIAINGSFEQIVDLLMWRDVAKSTLWFGFGSTFFLSSYLSSESSFSILSAMSHVGLLVLGVAFIKNTVIQRQQCDSRQNLQLTEDDILRAARLILPVVNVALTKIQDIFSGDPLRTLKVAPVLLLGAKYGHLITLWRLLVTGFFLSFTVPNLYLSYSQQIHRTAENATRWILEEWRSCNYKRFVVLLAATTFWNFFSAKTRFFAAFILVVMLRYRQQHKTEEENKKESKELETQQDTVAAEQMPLMQLDCKDK